MRYKYKEVSCHLKEVADQVGLQEELKAKELDRVLNKKAAIQENTEKEVISTFFFFACVCFVLFFFQERCHKEYPVHKFFKFLSVYLFLSRFYYYSPFLLLFLFAFLSLSLSLFVASLLTLAERENA